MSRPTAPAIVTAIARLLLRVYPARFRAAHREDFEVIAADRWQRERVQGRSALGATLRTVRVLLSDTWPGVRLAGQPAGGRAARRRPAAWVDRRRADLRWAIRGLARAPLLTAVATISLGLGIGATSAVGAAARALIFAAPAGVAEAHRLANICRTDGGTGCDTLAYPTFLDYRDRTRAFTEVWAEEFVAKPFSLGTADGGRLVYAAEVSANYFAALGAHPARGGFFSTTDPRRSPLPEVVVSYAFWRDALGADPALVGGTVTLNGDPYTLMGVAADGFEGTTIVRPDFWLPLTAGGRGLPPPSQLASRGSLWVLMGGRLAPGATRAGAQAEASVIMDGLRAAYPGVYGGRGLAVLPSARMPDVTGAPAFLGFLMALAVTILGVACANLTGLLLARTTDRMRELAVRRALGATRGALVALSLVDTAVLFLPGVALAFPVALVALAAIGRLATRLPIPVDASLPIDGPVIGFTVVVAAVLAVATALGPGWQAAAGPLVDTLKQDASAPRRQRLRQVFVAGQIAFSLVSIAMAGLLLHAVEESATIDPGFRVAGVDVASVDFGFGHYRGEDGAQAATDLGARLAALPGVAEVGIGSVIPLTGTSMGFGDLRRAGDRSRQAVIDASWSLVSPEYFAALQIPLVRGRLFTAADRADGPTHAIVNETFAERAWPGRDAVGQGLDVEEDRGMSRRVTVVGVARNAKYEFPGERPTAFIYVPLAEQHFLHPTFFLVRRPGADEAALGAAVRETLARFDRTLPLVAFAPLDTYTTVTLLPERIAASVAGALGLLALGLAAVGLYGLTACTVAARTRELGIRVALGATGRQVVGRVVGEGLRLAAIGASLGALVALGAARLLSASLSGIAPLDPVAFGGSLTAVAAIALAATYLPARRAVAINPIVALRSE